MNIARTALLSSQTAIDLTGTNIANVNTPGYTRQRAVLSETAGSDAGAVQTRTGVEISAIERMYDRFLESRIIESESSLSYFQTMKEELDKVEMIFNESQEGGIADMMNAFWAAWEDLSANPSGQPERVALVSVSESLAHILRTSGQELVDLQNSINRHLSDLVIQANSCIDAVADLNMKIMESTAQQGNINDLLDKRTESLNDLAQSLNFTFTEGKSGTLNICLPDGTPLVTEGTLWHLEVRTGSDNAFSPSIAVEGTVGDDGENMGIKGGKIAALVDMRDEIIGGETGYLNRLDGFVSTFAARVNAIHSAGFDAYCNAGGDFFTCETASHGQSAPSLLNIRLMSAISSDVMRIAASSTVSGDGANARSMGALKDTVIASGGEEGTLNGHYASFVSRIGQDGADSRRACSHQEILMNQMIHKRLEKSGVSIDEEMLNLIKFQMGYQSAARLCSVAEEMLDTLMTLGR
jgi:flagellar hook-associated protein 1 FlgK